MRTFFIACAAAIVIAVVGVALLEGVQQNADKAFTTTGVRLGS